MSTKIFDMTNEERTTLNDKTIALIKEKKTYLTVHGLFLKLKVMKILSGTEENFESFAWFLANMIKERKIAIDIKDDNDNIIMKNILPDFDDEGKRERYGVQRVRYEKCFIKFFEECDDCDRRV